MKTNAFGKVKYAPADIFSDRKSLDSIRDLLHIWFQILGIDENSVGSLVSETIASCERSTPLSENLEEQLLDTYNSFDIVGKMNALLANRAEQIFGYLIPYMPSLPCSVLDIGAGTGLIGKRFYDAGFDVALQDIKGDRERRVPEVVALEKAERPLPYYLQEPDEALQFADSAYDTSFLAAVLHHCDNPLLVLEGAKKVTKQRLFVLESVYGVEKEEVPESVYNNNKEVHDLFFSIDKEQQKKYQAFLDWFINKVNFRNNANVPFNFNSLQGWEQVFTQKRLNIAERRMLGTDQVVTPEFHVLYVLEK